MFREGLRPPDPWGENGSPLERLRTQDDMTVASLVELGPVCIVLLPALGKRTTRAVLQQMASERARIEESGWRLLLVHMASDDARAKAELAPFNLAYVARLADPEREMYEHFGMKRATLAQRWGVDAVKAAWSSRSFGSDEPVGDPDQLGGVVQCRSDADPHVWSVPVAGKPYELPGSPS